MSRWNKVLLSKNRPDLLVSWDFAKNRSICTPEEVSIGSHVKVWWLCENGHSWMMEIRKRVGGSSCPFCSGRRTLSGFNDLASLRPDLLDEWDYLKNELSPQSVGLNKYRASWICSKCGHKWEATIRNRVNGTGCPICGIEKRRIKNETADYCNSLANNFPEILNEWNYEKNKGIDPRTIYPRSNKKAWWICQRCGNEYFSSKGNRTHGSGCPICTGKKVISGVNDLITWCMANNKGFIIDEWDNNKNHFLPEETSPFTSKKAWFLCKEGHSYYATISNRTSNNTGCPECMKGKKTSFPEQAVYYYIKSNYPNTTNSFHAQWLERLEIDIYIPELNTAIEYDGIAWHDDREKDLRKNTLCMENGVNLIRIREQGMEALENCINVFVENDTNNALDKAIIETLKILGCSCYDVNTKRDTPIIVKLFDYRRKMNSISVQFPELINEWDFNKNAGVDPQSVSYGSMRKYWWKCPICNYNWQMSPNARTNQRQGCPKCSGPKRVNSYINTLLNYKESLAETNHPVLDEWDYERNDILPSQITKSSGRKVWWKCKKCGGCWLAEINNRTKENGTKCPYCAGHKVLKGFNDLATTHSELLSEWNYEKNNGKSPDMYSAGSSVRIWWKCTICGYEWQTTINQRTDGEKCPVCQRKRVSNMQQVSVINLDTGVIYNSIVQAAESCNGSSGSICSCCKGKQKTAHGYRWAYVNENKK